MHYRVELGFSGQDIYGNETWEPFRCRRRKTKEGAISCALSWLHRQTFDDERLPMALVHDWPDSRREVFEGRSLSGSLWVESDGTVSGGYHTFQHGGKSHLVEIDHDIVKNLG